VRLEPAADGAAQGKGCASELLCVHVQTLVTPACALPAAPGSRSSSARLALECETDCKRAASRQANLNNLLLSLAYLAAAGLQQRVWGARGASRFLVRRRPAGMHASMFLFSGKVSAARLRQHAWRCKRIWSEPCYALIAKLLRGNKWLCKHAVTDRMRIGTAPIARRGPRRCGRAGARWRSWRTPPAS
jgi:hypothetical protein